MIRVEGLRKSYGSGAGEVLALRGIDLTVDRGEFVGLVGPSGSGKTSLLNILGCLDRPTSGKVFLDSRDLFAMTDREMTRFRAGTLGFIFQSFNLFDLLTARENVEYPLALARRPASERSRLAAEALQRVGLGEKLSRLPGELSGGEKQRVAIARALVHRPDLVLADEPTANLDSETGATIVRLLRELNRELRTTFVISTHDRDLISELGRVLAIRDGSFPDSGA